MDELPEIVPLFPLPNVVLFPHVDLPLHVFEPRYREMVHDAMASHRLIGMVLLRGDWRRNYHGSPEIFPVGCAGRIERFELLEDGRSNLSLRGVRTFELLQEVPGLAYRRARVRWHPADAPIEEGRADALRLRLRQTVTRLLERGDRPVPKNLFERLPAELERLVSALGFGLEIGMIEKLSVLECPDVALRAERLIEVLEFHLAERGLGATGEGGEGPWH